MNGMTNPIKLLVCDVDNTLLDTMDFWGKATGKCIRELAQGLDLVSADLAKAVLSAPGQYRFCDFGALVDWLEKNGHLGRAENPLHAYEREIVKNYARQAWFEQQRQRACFYNGVPETFRKFKQGGAAIAFYTDTEASSLIRRFWLMAYNAAGRDLNNAMTIMDQVDHFYAMPSIECDQRILRDVPYDFSCAMKKRMTVWQDQQRKPSVPHIHYILRDFGALPEESVMVGDSDKDAGCTPEGMSFAWARYGATLSDDVVEVAKLYASPDYKYGLAAIEDAIVQSRYRVDVTLHREFAELLDHFHGAPGAAFSHEARHSAQTGHPSHRSSGAAKGDRPAGWRVSPVFRLQSHPMPPWLPTHLPQELQGTGSSDVVYTADPEKTGLQISAPVLAA